jgi:hypothetical protein
MNLIRTSYHQKPRYPCTYIYYAICNYANIAAVGTSELEYTLMLDYEVLLWLLRGSALETSACGLNIICQDIVLMRRDVTVELDSQ